MLSLSLPDSDRYETVQKNSARNFLQGLVKKNTSRDTCLTVCSMTGLLKTLCSSAAGPLSSSTAPDGSLVPSSILPSPVGCSGHSLSSFPSPAYLIISWKTLFRFAPWNTHAGPVLHGGCCGGSWPYQHPARTERGTQFVLLCGNQGLKQEGVQARTSAAVTPDKKHRHGNSNSVVQLQHGHPQMNVPRKQTFRSLRLF